MTATVVGLWLNSIPNAIAKDDSAMQELCIVIRQGHKANDIFIAEGALLITLGQALPKSFIGILAEKLLEFFRKRRVSQDELDIVTLSSYTDSKEWATIKHQIMVAASNEEVESWRMKVLEKWDLEDILQWLKDKNLEQYCASFKANDLDGKSLLELNDSDLFDLGIESIEHRNSFIRLLNEAIKFTYLAEDVEDLSICAELKENDEFQSSPEAKDFHEFAAQISEEPSYRTVIITGFSQSLLEDWDILFDIEHLVFAEYNVLRFELRRNGILVSFELPLTDFKREQLRVKLLAFLKRLGVDGQLKNGLAIDFYEDGKVIASSTSFEHVQNVKNPLNSSYWSEFWADLTTIGAGENIIDSEESIVNSSDDRDFLPALGHVGSKSIRQNSGVLTDNPSPQAAPRYSSNDLTIDFAPIQAGHVTILDENKTSVPFIIEREHAQSEINGIPYFEDDELSEHLFVDKRKDPERNFLNLISNNRSHIQRKDFQRHLNSLSVPPVSHKPHSRSHTRHISTANVLSLSEVSDHSPTASTGPLVSWTDEVKEPEVDQDINKSQSETNARIARLRSVHCSMPLSGPFNSHFARDFAKVFWCEVSEEELDERFILSYWKFCIELLSDKWCTYEIFKLYLSPWKFKMAGLGNPTAQDISEIYTEIFQNKNRCQVPDMFVHFWTSILLHEDSLRRSVGTDSFIDVIGCLPFRFSCVFCFPSIARMIWVTMKENNLKLDNGDWEYIFSTHFNNFCLPMPDLLLTVRFICREVSAEVQMFTHPETAIVAEEALQYVTWNTTVLFEIAYSLPYLEFHVFYPQMTAFISSLSNLYYCAEKVVDRVSFALEQGVNMRKFRDKRGGNAYFYSLFPLVRDFRYWDHSLVNVIVSFI